MAKSLPCNPCPHAALCCSWGAEVTSEEADAISKDHPHGYGVITFGLNHELRTAVDPGWGCVFLKPDHTCSIHDKPYYPAACRAYPASDELTHYERLGCPELYRKESE